MITHHSELIACKEHQLESVSPYVCNAVKKSVLTEIRSYSDAVSVRAYNISNTKSLKKAVKEVVHEDDWSKSSMEFGLKEKEDTNSAISERLQHIGEKPLQVAVWIGRIRETSTGDQPRPVESTVSDSEQVLQILRTTQNHSQPRCYIRIAEKSPGNSHQSSGLWKKQEIAIPLKMAK